MSLHIAAYNPMRQVDWKWQRAVAIHEGSGMTTTRRRDTPQGHAWIQRAYRFKNDLENARTDAARETVADNHYDIFWAHWIWSSENPMKYSIEAHILAREDNFEIGFRCGAAPAVVEAYEQLFFNVREKLQHRKYIANVVMGPAVHRGLSEREFDLLWKLYGYNIGSHVLDALEDKFANPMWCGTPDGVGAAIQDDAISTLKLKSALAAKTVAVNGHTQLALLEQFTKFVEVERNTDSSGKAAEQILENIQAMMITLPFNVGGRDPRTGTIIDRGPLEPYEIGSIELTFEETMRVSVRQPIANAETLRALAFPVTESTQIIEAEEH